MLDTGSDREPGAQRCKVNTYATGLTRNRAAPPEQESQVLFLASVFSLLGAPAAGRQRPLAASKPRLVHNQRCSCQHLPQYPPLPLSLSVSISARKVTLAAPGRGRAGEPEEHWVGRGWRWGGVHIVHLVRSDLSLLKHTPSIAHPLSGTEQNKFLLFTAQKVLPLNATFPPIFHPPSRLFFSNK